MLSFKGSLGGMPPPPFFPHQLKTKYQEIAFGGAFFEDEVFCHMYVKRKEDEHL